MLTPVLSFGQQAYVFPTVDKLLKNLKGSIFIWEQAKYVLDFLYSCFVVMGILKTIKADNRPSICFSKS